KSPKLAVQCVNGSWDSAYSGWWAALRTRNTSSPIRTLWRKSRIIWIGHQPGETVLINAVGSGVGLAAVQLVRAIHAVPYGTSRTPSKLDQAKNYGMHDGLVVRDNFEDLLAAMEQLTHGQGVNVMLDLVGGPYVKTGQKLLGLKGR